MADLGSQEFWMGLGVLIAFLVGVGAIGWVSYRGYVDRKRRLELEAELAAIWDKEDMQMLRHRDLDAFVQRVNALRQQKGQSPIEKEFIAKIQYNLMYALDESDVGE